MRTDRFFTVEWWNRNWKWALTGCGCALVVVIALFLAGMLGFTTFVMRASGGYREAVTRVQGDCEVQELLGAPVEAGWFVWGSTETTGPTGHSDLSFRVSGPRGKGTVYLIADKRAGQWELELLELAAARGQRLDLLAGERRRCD